MLLLPFFMHMGCAWLYMFRLADEKVRTTQNVLRLALFDKAISMIFCHLQVPTLSTAARESRCRREPIVHNEQNAAAQSRTT